MNQTPTLSQSVKFPSQSVDKNSPPESESSNGALALAERPDFTVAEQKAEPARRFNIQGSVVREAVAHMSEEARDLLLWLHKWAWDNDMTPLAVGQRLRRSSGDHYDGNYVYKILTGKSEGKPDKFLEAVRSLRRTEDERSTITRVEFIETNLTKRIFQICESARIYQKIIYLYGESQIGKSTSLEEYARQFNHGSTVYVRLSAGGRLRCFLEELNFALRNDHRSSPRELRRLVTRAFNSGMLLIIDEAHQLFLGRAQLETAEFIRELHDRCKVGIIFAGTKVFRAETQSGRHKELLQQLNLRTLAPVKLPDRPSADDLRKFSAAYGLPPAAEKALVLQTDIIRDSGLGLWCTYLQAASRVAAKKKTKLTWVHVLEAYDGLKRLESGAL